MRILAVTPYYAPEGGGLERYAHEILSRLVEQGHAVQAIAFTEDQARSTSQDGIHVDRVEPALRLGNSPIRLSFPRRVGETIDTFEPDVVLAHTPVPFPAESAYLAARRRGVPFAVTFHAGQLRGSSGPLELVAQLHRRTLQEAMLSGSRRLIAVSPLVRDRALAKHAERTTIVPPGVDADRFAPDGSPEGREVLFVGPLSTKYTWKGLDILWEAYEKVSERVGDARLRLIGEGDRLEDFRRRARGMDGHVHLPGRVSEDELLSAFQNARVVVLPSTSDAESFGMVLAEANACGRPVVGSRVGGIPGFIEDGHNGLLARPGDPEDLADKLVQLLEDPARADAMGKRGRQLVLEEHDWDHLAARTERVLTETLEDETR